MKIELESCHKPFYAPNGHSQTLLGFLFPSQKLTEWGRKVELKLADGDCLVGRFIEGVKPSIIYLFHGLSGSISSNYMQRTALLAIAQGHSVFLVNHRGCGEGQGLARLPYHSGRAEDLSAAISYGKKLFPTYKHLAIGFSLSGNALLLLLTGRRGDVKPDYAITVNAAIHLEQSAHQLKVGLNKIYDREFVKVCTQDVRRVHGDAYHFPKGMDLYEFDRLYTAPVGGFKSREDYYASCSTYSCLHEIQTPLVILSAKDDPFVLSEYYEKARLSSSTFLHLEEFGGHLGYLTSKNTVFGTKRWLDYALDKMIQELLSS